MWRFFQRVHVGVYLAHKNVVTVPQVFDSWQDPQERYDLFMNNFTERIWTRVPITDAIIKLMKTCADYPPRKLQSMGYDGPIELSQYPKFQYVRDVLKKEGINLPQPAGNCTVLAFASPPWMPEDASVGLASLGTQQRIRHPKSPALCAIFRAVCPIPRAHLQAHGLMPHFEQLGDEEVDRHRPFAGLPVIG